MLYRILFLVCLFGLNAFAQSECPTISIITPNRLLAHNNPETFSVKFSDDRTTQGLKFVWGSSAGAIANPFTGPTMQLVTMKNDGGKNVYIFVRVEGLPENCRDTAWEVISVQPYREIHPFDEFGALPANNVKAIIDGFNILLNQNPSYIGLVEMTFGSRESTRQRLMRINRIVAAIKFRGYDINRYSFLVSDLKDTTGQTRLIMSASKDQLPDMLEELPPGKLVSGVDVMKDPKKALPIRLCPCNEK